MSFRRSQLQHRRIRGFIHTWVNVASKRKCWLKDETLEHLHRVRKEVIEQLPDFKAGTARKRPTWLEDPVDYGKFIHKLIDQTVFQKFNFVRLNKVSR